MMCLNLRHEGFVFTLNVPYVDLERFADIYVVD